MNTRVMGMAAQADGAAGHADGQPPVPYRRLSALLPLGLMTALLGVGGAWLLDETTLPVRHVRVEGDFKHLSTVALQERAGEVVRGGFFNVNVETIKEVLLEEPWIHSVSVKRVWPDSITVTIHEQIAVARWNDSGLLNAGGDLFTPQPSTLPDGLPRLRGPEDTHDQVLGFYQRLGEVMPPSLTVSELSLSDRRAWRIGFTGGPQVYLGRMDIATRVRRFARYVPAALAGYAGHIESVDMRYTNGFAVQWKPGNKPDL